MDISISTLPEPLVSVLAEVSDCTPFAALPLKVVFLIPCRAVEVEEDAVFVVEDLFIQTGNRILKDLGMSFKDLGFSNARFI